MKQAWNDLKSFVTVAVILTLVALIIIMAIKGNWDMFQIVFTLFSSVTASVITYFFTKKSESKTTNDTTQE
ncbi:MAG: hypothetical protein HFJ26_03865 [Clostridia bacterium]|nr:hypothetical protein [Clostridia bacterium]